VDAYIAGRTTCYPAIKWLNKHATAAYRAWNYDCQDVRYYARGTLIGDIFSTGSVLRIFDNYGVNLPNDTTLWTRLEPLHVEWAILPESKVARPALLERHHLFELVADAGPEEIFTVAPNRHGA
jgi:hypothetical protein